MDYWWKEMETRKSRTHCRLAFRQTYLWRILSLSLKWGWTFSCSWICGMWSYIFSRVFVVVVQYSFLYIFSVLMWRWKHKNGNRPNLVLPQFWAHLVLYKARLICHINLSLDLVSSVKDKMKNLKIGFFLAKVTNFAKAIKRWLIKTVLAKFLWNIWKLGNVKIISLFAF